MTQKNKIYLSNSALFIETTTLHKSKQLKLKTSKVFWSATIINVANAYSAWKI